jgi:hypothetical protein
MRDTEIDGEMDRKKESGRCVCVCEREREREKERKREGERERELACVVYHF